MYELVLSSRKKDAVAFKRWITKEVLPSIRKHGAYVTDNLATQVMNDPDKLYGLAEALIKEKSERMEIARSALLLSDKVTALSDEKKELAETLVLKNNSLYHQNHKIEQLQISEDYLQKNVLPSECLVSSTELGGMIGMSATAMHRWLADQKVLRWVNGRNVLTAKYANEDFTRDVCYSYTHTNGTVGTNRRIMWTEGGVQFVCALHNLINRKEQPGLFEE